MTAMQNLKKVPVWVDIKRCKACDICASVCPAGVLAMSYDPTSTLGSMVNILHPEACIGCGECELSCPDFAIFVSDKQDYKFSKLSTEAKQRAEELALKNYRV